MTALDARRLARFHAAAHGWHRAAGRCTLRSSANAAEPLRTVSLPLSKPRLAP